MKAFWHTKTLFIQAWKYKWSYKHDHCIKCLWVSFKHKGNWLCTSCWDKERTDNPLRKASRYKASMKFHNANYVRIPRDQWKKMWPKPTGFDEVAYKKQWYQKNKLYLATLKKWKLWLEKWIPCISYRGYPLPLQDLDKPYTKMMSESDEEIAINSWKERMKLFDMMRIYIDKKLSK